MTKSNEKQFITAIEPFIRSELSFVVTEDDKECGISGRRDIVVRDGYNYELGRMVYGEKDNDLIEYRILRTPYPYVQYNDEVFRNVMTESVWVHFVKGKITHYDYMRKKHKANCCELCKLCNPKTEITSSFNIIKHNDTKKHTNNVIVYNANIKETLGKKNIGDDIVNEIMSYL